MLKIIINKYLAILTSPHVVYNFKPGACGIRLYTWFLKIALVHAFVCVCISLPICLSVCVSASALITNGGIWCDIDHVRLVKQVLWLFPALITLYV